MYRPNPKTMAKSGGLAALALPLTMAAAFADVTVRYATIQTPQFELSVEVEGVFDRIEEETEGRVKFQPLYGSESGFNAKQYISSLEFGLLDAALIPTSSSALEYPWLSLYGLPFFAEDGQDRAEMVKVTEPILEEFSADHNIIPLAYPLRSDPYLVIYSKKDVPSLADFKGMLIRVFDPSTNKIVSELGGVPTSLQKSEVYMGLQRGTIDGAITGVTDAEGMKFDEVVDYAFQLDVNMLPHILGFSQSVWDKIDEPDQEVIREAFADWEADYLDRTLNPEGGYEPYAYFESHGIEVILPNDAIKEVFAKIRNEAIEDYVAQGELSERAYEEVKKAH